jgi:hypothetical protein
MILIQRLSDAMRYALLGFAADGNRDTWITEYLLPSLKALGLEVTDTGALARAQQLRDGARAQCERRTAELAEAHARLRIADRDAAVGRAVLDLADQICRLRDVALEHPDAFPFTNTPANVAALLTGELGEVLREPVGSADAQRECGDVLAAAMHLMIAHEGCLLAEVDATATRPRSRSSTARSRNRTRSGAVLCA